MVSVTRRFVLFAIAALAGLCVIAVRKPHIELTEVRATSTPQTVEVTWYLGCEEDYYEDAEKHRYLPQVPVGGDPPVLGPVMNAGTRFVLTGYPYTAIKRNRITGQVERQRSARFDVIEWHVVPPYGDQPVEWKSAEGPVQFVAQVERRHKTC